MTSNACKVSLISQTKFVDYDISEIDSQNIYSPLHWSKISHTVHKNLCCSLNQIVSWIYNIHELQVLAAAETFIERVITGKLSLNYWVTKADFLKSVDKH